MSKGISIKPGHFKQYKDIAFLLLKFGQLPGSGLLKVLDPKFVPGLPSPPVLSDTRITSENTQFAAATLVQEIEKMGPTYVRLGQLLALRPNLLPLPYLDALTRLGKNCPALDFATIKQTVEGELGRNLSEVFLSFEETPLSVSVLEQTHLAVLLRNQEAVVVKVQRPGVKEQSMEDLQALNEFASLIDEHSSADEEFEFHEAVEVFRRTIISDLDYRQEIHNLKALCEYVKHLDSVVVPHPIESLSTSKVLLIKYLDGAKLPEATRLSSLLRSERTKLADQIFGAYMQQFLVYGFVHADPDPNNMLLTKEGKIAILDLGVVDRISPAMQTKLIQLLLSISEGRADQTAGLLVAMCRRRKNFDENAFSVAVSELVLAHRDHAVGQKQIGDLFRGIIEAASKYGAALPWELSELAAALGKLGQVAMIIDPRFDTNAFVDKATSQSMNKHMSQALSPAHIFHTVVETSEFLESLPSKFSKILDSVANNNLKVTVHAIDEKVLISGFQKIANRITVGIVIAALIMGAALLMRINTEFRIFGYPGLAIICFTAAAACGFFLVIEVLVGDTRKSSS